MAYKRLIGVLTIKDGRLVKSYGYSMTRPAGNLISALQNLDRWLVDEILILDISRQSGIAIETLKAIESAKISTPLMYGGGIRELADITSLLSAGCERFLIETMIYTDVDTLTQLAGVLGRQALVASLPVSIDQESNLILFNKHSKFSAPSNEDPEYSVTDFYRDLPVSEIIVIDAQGEGRYSSFNMKIAEKLIDKLDRGVIWFGGISSLIAEELFKLPDTVAVGFGNINHEREIVIPNIRSELRKHNALHMPRATRL